MLRVHGTNCKRINYKQNLTQGTTTCQKRKRYRKLPEFSVTAVQFDLDLESFKYQKWGHEQTCEQGDWLVNNGGDIYTIKKDVFMNTYQMVSPGVYEKDAEMWVETASKDGKIPTREGATNYKVGDYLVFDRKNGGDGYAIHKQKFERLYEEVSTDSDKPTAARKEKAEVEVIRFFLASSSELKRDRDVFEIFINRKNKEYVRKGVFIELVMWEDFIDAMSPTRLQDEYNKTIEQCEVFISLFHKKVGTYTEEEFTKAYETFKAKGKPLVYTYFKDAPIKMSEITPEIKGLLNFKEKLARLGHFYTVYNDINDLKYKFGEQLIKLFPKLASK